MKKEEEKPRKTAKKSSKKTTKKPSKTVKKSAKKTQKPRKKAQSLPKGSRSDGVQASVSAAQKALSEIEPPAHVKLKKAELVFWDSIINEFAKVEWTDHMLELAAMLARNMYAYEKAQRKLAKDGEVLPRKSVKRAKEGSGQADKVIITGYSGNPIKSFIKMYHENVMSMRRSLSLQTRVKDGEPRDRANARAGAKDVEKKMSGLDDKMSLIARPSETVQ